MYIYMYEDFSFPCCVARCMYGTCVRYYLLQDIIMINPYISFHYVKQTDVLSENILKEYGPVWKPSVF